MTATSVVGEEGSQDWPPAADLGRGATGTAARQAPRNRHREHRRCPAILERAPGKAAWIAGRLVAAVRWCQPVEREDVQPLGTGRRVFRRESEWHGEGTGRRACVNAGRGRVEGRGSA
jgi:hypothetical protein